MIKYNFKSLEYYQKELDRADYNLKRFKDSIAGIGEGIQPIQANRFYIVTNGFLCNKIKLLYLVGGNAEEIKIYIKEYVDNLRERFRLNLEPLCYSEIENAMSWVYLYDLDFDMLAFLKEAMIPEKYVDACLDIIRNKIYTGSAFTDKEFYFKEKGYFSDYAKSAGGIIDVVNAPRDEQTKLFLKFLKEVKEKHYKRLINSCKKTSEEQYTYVGSFDYRLTAVAKALELDKKQLEDSIFIAADLL